MYMNLRLFLVSVYQTLTRAPVTWRRLRTLVPLVVGLPLFELFTWAALGLDEILFRRYRRVPVNSPLFIIGNPRSGTTLLHRLIALDEEQFTGFTLGEILFPAITQQRVLQALARVDRRLGRPLARLGDRVQDVALRGLDHIHRTRLGSPEEDELLLLHKFATPILFMLFPGAQVLGALWDYDDLPQRFRLKLDRYYLMQVKRLLYRKGEGRRFLSKNTVFGAKIRSLNAMFPDARFLYILRNPEVSIASTQNLFHTVWETQLTHEQLETQRRRVVEKAAALYRRALTELDKLPQDRKYIMLYEDLVADPARAVTEAYQALGIPMSEAYRERLREAAEKARRFKSRHRYSLEQFGMTRDMVRQAVPFVYERFSFKESMASSTEGQT